MEIITKVGPEKKGERYQMTPPHDLLPTLCAESTAIRNCRVATLSAVHDRRGHPLFSMLLRLSAAPTAIIITPLYS